jgi:hypothetical protein
LEASRLGKLAQAGRTSTGVAEVDEARLAAHHRSERRGVMRKKRKVVEATVPARKSRADLVWLPARRKAVAEVVRRRLASNKLGFALQKERQGRVNGGLALS